MNSPPRPWYLKSKEVLFDNKSQIARLKEKNCGLCYETFLNIFFKLYVVQFFQFTILSCSCWEWRKLKKKNDSVE